MVSRSIFHFSLLHTWISSHPYVLQNLRYESRLSFKISHLICQGWNMIVNRNHLINQMLFIVQEKKTEFEHISLTCYFIILPWPPPYFWKENADRGKLPSCFTERLKNHLKCLIWILFGTKQFVFNGTSEASSVVKWDFFEWFLTTIFWKEKYRKIAQLFTGTDAHCLQII